MVSIKLTLATSIAVVLCGVASPLYGQTYTACEGEYERNCGFQHQGYTYCGTIDDWAKGICLQSGGSGEYTKVQLNLHDGNKCGYSLWQVTCK
jgi:hypothetical protein